MNQSIKLAKAKGVAVGAHPGFPDKVGFGRRDMTLSYDELYCDTIYQIGALKAFLSLYDMPLHHVKPHGALHHRMVKDRETCEAVIAAIHDVVPDIPLVALAGPGGLLMQETAQRLKLPFVLEAFPERGYLADGRLCPRDRAGASIHDPELAAERALAMSEGYIMSLEGEKIPLKVDTLCIHGDNPHAIEIAKAIYKTLKQAGIALASF
ncbi:MAG: 5-oxoprolinase subunit PxpA [Deinococcales bacterium]